VFARTQARFSGVCVGSAALPVDANASCERDFAPEIPLRRYGREQVPRAAQTGAWVDLKLN
jgi:hypothetical protein